MKTIRELIEEKGRGVIEAMIESINKKQHAYVLLSKDEQELLSAVFKDGGVQVLDLKGKWVDRCWNTPFRYLRTYRIHEDYELPEDEPEDESEDEPEVFWGERKDSLPAPIYLRPDGTYAVWSQLAGWAEENGWEFYGFCTIEGGGKMSRRPYFPFYCQHDGKVCIRPFAKFVRKNDD